MNLSLMHPARTVKTFVFGLAVSLVIAVAAGIGPVYAQSVSFNSKRNCDTNAILNCGAMSISELQQKYAQDTKAQKVYAWYGITADTISNLPNTAVAGDVTKTGNVEVKGQVVATNAISAGYHNMPGSTPVTVNGVTFYNSAPSTSFLSDKIDAFVVLNKNGQFVTAILASCGNSVKATNKVPAPAPKTPAPQTPAPQTPAPQVPQAAAPVTTQAPETQAPTLVNTGPGSVAAVFAGTSVVAAAGHAFYKRRKSSLSM